MNGLVGVLARLVDRCNKTVVEKQVVIIRLLHKDVCKVEHDEL